MAVELATYYVSIIPSARGIEANIARELAPVSGLAAAEGAKAGKVLGGGISKGIAGVSIASSLERETTKGSGVLTEFAAKTGTLFQGLDRQLGAFGGPFSGSLNQVGTSLRAVELGEGRVASGASELQRVATAAYVGVGLAAVAFGGVSIKAALGAEQANAQLGQSYKAVGADQGAFQDQIDGTVERLSRFGFDAEEVTASLATLTRASKDPQKALDNIGLAADIARARNLSLADASQLLTRILAGQTRGLSQLGISSKDASGKTITAAVALERINALFGGSAAANAKTYAGELQAAGAEAHNLEEEVGGALLPVVADFGKELVSGVHGLQDINAATHGWAGALSEAAFIGGGVVILGGKLASAAASVADKFRAQAQASEAVAAADEAGASAATARAAATGVLVDLEQAEVAASLELTAAEDALAAAIDSAAFATGAEAASETEILGLIEARTAAEAELTAAIGVRTAAQGTEAASGLGASFFSGGLGALGTSDIVPGLAAVAAGLFLGAKGGDALNKALAGAKPNADQLTSSLRQLEQQGGSLEGFDFHKLAGDLTTSQGSALQKGFGFSASSHRAVQDIGAVNDALKAIEKTDGTNAAALAFAGLQRNLEGLGISSTVISSEFGPFLEQLGSVPGKADAAGTSAETLKQQFTDLSTSFSARSAQLGIADQFDTVKQDLDAVDQLKLDAVGQGQKSIDAARTEQQAQQSLTDAYRSQDTAAASLTDAKAKLAQFNGPTDTTIRSLERTQIVDRIVTTPEEARQKEIDLLSFDESNAQKRQDLQKQVASAENGVQSATEGVARAQQAVATASQARKQIQVDAAQAIAGAERKAQEAILAAGKAINDANVAGQLGAGNTQLDIYIGLLDQLANRLAPNSVLSKTLDTFLAKIAANHKLDPSHLKLGPFEAPPQGLLAPPSGLLAAPSAPTGPGPIGPGGPRGATGPALQGNVTIAPVQHITIKGADAPSLRELDTLNRKQALRIAARGNR